MDFTEQLRILQAAQGDPALLALATVDMAHHSLSEPERKRLKEALLAAAVPHWCDGPFLAALLQTTEEESELLLTRLRSLNVIEPFPARGLRAVNVHEAARLVLREYLRNTDESTWSGLATRARVYVQQHDSPHARIEALYQLFAVDQNAAATECEDLERELTLAGRPETRHALAAAMSELITAGWLTGAAEVEAKLCALEVRNDRGEEAQLDDAARSLLASAMIAQHGNGIARANCLLGDALHAKGDLNGAMVAYHEFLSYFQLPKPGLDKAVGWQFNLGMAHSRIGDIHQAQGQPGDALKAYHQYLFICKNLVEIAPSNAGWQRCLAIAYSKVGGIYQLQGNLCEALTAHMGRLGICESLAKRDQSNTEWQRSLAVAHYWLGSVYHAQAQLGKALDAYREALRISQLLAGQDPTNARWQRDLAAEYAGLGGVYEAQANASNALSAYNEELVISRRLVDQDPANAEWHRCLALACHRVGIASHALGDEPAFTKSFQQAVDQMEKAVAMAPLNVGWQKDLENIKGWL